MYERARLQLSEIDLLTEEQRNGYLSSLEKVVACLKECEKLSNERNELQEALKNTLEQYELLLRKKEESEKELADVSVVMKQSREELEVCKEKVPPEFNVGKDHVSACFLNDSLNGKKNQD